MSMGTSWWHHIKCGRRLLYRHGYPCHIWWICRLGSTKMSLWNLVILCQTVLGIYEPLTLWWTNDADENRRGPWYKVETPFGVSPYKKPTNWWGKAKCHATRLYILSRRSVKFIMIIPQTWPNYALICRKHPFYALFVQSYLIAFCGRPDIASDVVSCRFVRLIVQDKLIKFRNPGLNLSREIPPEAIRGGFFERW